MRYEELLDIITKEVVDAVKNKKLAEYYVKQEKKSAKLQQDIARAKTPLTVKELEEKFPSLLKMLTRQSVYVDAKQQKASAQKSTVEPGKPTVADYGKTIEEFYNDLGINKGKEYVIDGDRLGLYYTDAVNFADLSLDDLYAVANYRESHGKKTEVPGNLVWQATLAEKQNQLNKGKSAGI